MASSNLPVTVDSTYADSTDDPSIKIHQQHHDAIHKIVNLIDKDAVPTDGQVLVWSAASGTYVPKTVSTGPVGGTTTVTAAVGDKQVTLNWTTVTGATGYLVGRDGTGSDGRGPFSVTDPSTAVAHLFDNLTNGVAYTFFCEPQGVGLPAWPAAGHGRKSIAATPVSSTTTTPTTLTLTNITTSSITLNWTPVVGATSYLVGRDGVDSGGTGLWQTEDPANLTARQFNLLLPNTSYTFFVEPQPGGIRKSIIGTTAATAGGSDPTGDTMPVGNLAADAQAPSGWTQVTAVDFTTNCSEGQFVANYGTQFTFYPSDWFATARNSKYNSGSSMSVSNSVARERIYTDSTGMPRTEAIQPVGAMNLLYGRYRLKWRLPVALPGYKQAWLLWPQSEVWPRDGEIDFPEADFTTGSTISAFMHRQNGVNGGDQDFYGTNVSPVGTGWHVTEIIWAPNFCRFILDGVTIGTSTSRVPNTPMRWVIQSEGNLGGASIAPSTTGYIEFDWICAWRRA